MAEVLVDLNAQLISASHEVFVARPGKGYRLYRDFVEKSGIFVDLPDLDLINGVPLADQVDLEPKLRRSRALREWYLSTRATTDEPSHNLDDYRDGQDKRRISQLRSIVSGYFEKLKPGDLVIVPPSAFSSPAYIGEVISPEHNYINTTISRRYGESVLTGRSVRWLGNIEKRKLPDDILDATEKPLAFYLLARSLRPPIYEAAYENFINLASTDPDYIVRFSVTAPTFTTEADLYIQAFFSFIAANMKTLDSGTDALQSIAAALFAELGDYAPSLKTNVNSPGFVTLLSKRITPIVAAVLLALAVEIGVDAAESAENGTITIGNSKAPAGDQCTAQVSESVLTQLKLLRLTEWPEACRIAKMAADKTGIKGTVTIEKK